MALRAYRCGRPSGDTQFGDQAIIRAKRLSAAYNCFWRAPVAQWIERLPPDEARHPSIRRSASPPQIPHTCGQTTAFNTLPTGQWREATNASGVNRSAARPARLFAEGQGHDTLTPSVYVKGVDADGHPRPPLGPDRALSAAPAGRGSRPWHDEAVPVFIPLVSTFSHVPQTARHDQRTDQRHHGRLCPVAARHPDQPTARQDHPIRERHPCPPARLTVVLRLAGATRDAASTHPLPDAKNSPAAVSGLDR